MTEIILVLFLLCMVVQILFHQMVFGKLLSPISEEIKSTQVPSVSIIIAARNESKNLEGLIAAMKDQDHPNFEVIIVNDRSDDNSESVINKAILNLDDFQQVIINALPDGWTGKKYALSQGIQRASNEILLFTDADCLPKSKQWGTIMARAFNESIDIVLGYSPYQEGKSLLNHFIQFETLLTGLQYLGFSAIRRPYMGVGRNWAIRRTAYDLNYLKSMAHVTGGDDDLMINRLATKENTANLTIPSSQTISIPERSWSQYFKQKTRHLSVGVHYHKKDKTLLGVFTLTFLFGWIFFFSLLVSTINPYLILAAFGLRSLSFYSIFARVGQKFGSPIKFWALPVLDLCYSIYYPVVSLRALSTKSIKWK
ncbi:glycosyltransferase [Roseivirga sp. E12]|uniref:glycosyltransferase n=1 Tax=Roseivirga sp. E12 TaxID=2819237 RepID=UPI001ABC3BC7|nr:glycosyltransferase [Roseivirga sp. E12]MBO3700478.1 glycosyltransferase [Roseivirga sp. E12]